MSLTDEVLADLAEYLDNRADTCRELWEGADEIAKVRLVAKSSAYHHSASLVRQAAEHIGLDADALTE